MIMMSNTVEIVTIRVLLFCTNCLVYVTAIETIDVSRNCDSRFNVNALGDVYLELIESFSGGKCTITVEKNEEWDNDYPRLCVDPVRISGCRVRIDVHNIMLIEGYHDKHYNCSSDRDTFCAYVDRFVIVFKSSGIGTYVPDIRLKVYRGKSDYESYSYTFPGYLIAVMVVSILFIIGITVAVVMCRIYRQRTFMSMASRAHQPNQPQFSPYPTVQYSSSPQPAANVYPGTAGYPPPSGYGVQPPGTGYSTSQPVATGHIYQQFTDNSSHPSAPPDANPAQAPPSYQQALDMQQKPRA